MLENPQEIDIKITQENKDIKEITPFGPLLPSPAQIHQILYYSIEHETREHKEPPILPQLKKIKK